MLGKKDRDIKAIFEKFKSKLSLTLVALYDSAFFEQYKIPAFPHYIWLDENGIVQTTTGPDELNPMFLERFIAGFPIPQDEVISKQIFDDSKLFLATFNGGTDTGFLFRTFLSHLCQTQRTR